MNYGTSSGVYSISEDTGNYTTYTVTGLNEGATYFFAASAYDSGRMESSYSNEVSYTVPVTQATLSSITIAGPTQVNESSSATYTCTAAYSDGTSAAVSPTWSENSSAATISSAGVLTASTVSADQSTTLTASYGGRTDTHTVTIKNAAATLSSITIAGPTQVNESSSATYTCTATFSDGETSDVTSVAAWNITSDYAEISVAGNLTARSVDQSETITITAAYGQKAARLDVTILDTANTFRLIIETIGSGGVDMDPAADIYAEGTVVKLTALPDNAWVFDGWDGMVSDTDENTTFVTMNSDVTITVTYLEDDDLDGVSNAEEYGPEGYDADFDGNRDGIIDALQQNTASLHTHDYSHYVTLSCPAYSRLNNCEAVDAALMDNLPADWDIPFGHFDFTITNIPGTDISAVSFIVPEGVPFNTYYQYGPTPDQDEPHWYEFMYDPISHTGAIIEDNIVTVYYVDGERGDDDLEVNGDISCQGGPVNKETNQPQPPAPGPPASGLVTDQIAADSSGGGGGCFIRSLLH